jgi:hypothetical protein
MRKEWPMVKCRSKSTIRSLVLRAVEDEIRAQDALHPCHTPRNPGLHPLTCLGILISEVFEVFVNIIKKDHEALVKDLVSVAAVAVAWLESFAEETVDEVQD